MWKHFYSLDSAGEHGTLYQLRNLLNRSNVVEKPSRDFNACEDFLFLIVHSQVIMTALTTLKMKSLNDAPAHDTLLGPNPLSIWMLDVEERKKILDEVCSELVTRFVQFSYNQGCTTEVDGVFAYAKRLLSMGCFFLEYHDAIKEGDGLRVLHCWRYLLPIFLGTGRTNYSREILNMLYQQVTLSPRLSSQLLWSRFINVHGLPARNIPADLHMEHLNRIAKDAIKSLGANKTKRAIERVGKSIGMLSPLLHQFDQEHGLKPISGAHHRANLQKDLGIIVAELMKVDIFSIQADRKYPTFQSPRDLLHVKSDSDVRDWMVSRLETLKNQR